MNTPPLPSYQKFVNIGLILAVLVLAFGTVFLRTEMFRNNKQMRSYIEVLTLPRSPESIVRKAAEGNVFNISFPLLNKEWKAKEYEIDPVTRELSFVDLVRPPGFPKRRLSPPYDVFEYPMPGF